MKYFIAFSALVNKQSDKPVKICAFISPIPHKLPWCALVEALGRIWYTVNPL